MKHIQNMLILAATLITASCSQHGYYMPPNHPMGGYPQENAKQRQYLALPGQSTVHVGTEDADAAFDRQVQEYTQEPGAVDVTAVDPAVPQTDYDNTTYPGAVQPVVQQPAPTPTAAAGSADYAVQITNGTTGRLFVEAQDAAGHIFPCGPMFAGQSISSQPDPVGPLKGPITVVIRDPDKPGAPEIRRYQVAPPADYRGKTVGVTILPGGQYRADVDNQVYYTSPAPNNSGENPAQ